jgi:polysaccharide biosynthesis protein PslH
VRSPCLSLLARMQTYVGLFVGSRSMEQLLSYLWLTRFAPYPPRYGGDLTYSARLMENLATDAPVEVLSYREHPGEFPRMPCLNWNLIPWRPQPRWRSVIAGLPNVAAQYRRDAYVARMLELASEADAVIIDHLGMGWCAESLVRARAGRSGATGPSLIFIPIDHNKSLRTFVATQVRNPVMRALVAWDAFKAGRLEDRAVELSDGVIVLTERDRGLFQADHPTKQYLLLQPGYDGGVAPTRSINAGTPERICVLGGRGTFHKQIVLQQCLEALDRQGAPAANFDVVGDISDKLRTELQVRYPGLTFRGYIEDVDSYLATVRLGILPDAVGGGFKLRALTYAFNRVPMVAVRGALAGMGFTPGENYVEAPDLDSMIDEARGIVNDFDRLNQIQEAAFQHCQGQFEWRQRGAALHAFAQQLNRARPCAADSRLGGGLSSVYGNPS